MITRELLTREYPVITGFIHFRPMHSNCHIISCKSGDYALIRCRSSSPKGWVEQLEYAAECGFVNFAEPLPTRSGRYTLCTRSGQWFLRPYYAQMELGRVSNMQRAARILASLHACTLRRDSPSAECIATIHGNLSEASWLQGPGKEILLADYQDLSRGSPYEDLADFLILSKKQLPRDRLGKLLLCYSSVFPLPTQSTAEGAAEQTEKEKTRQPPKPSEQPEAVRQNARDAFLRGHLRSEDSDQWEPAENLTGPTPQQSARDSHKDGRPLQWVIPEVEKKGHESGVPGGNGGNG